jgi:hypothetical protein
MANFVESPFILTIALNNHGGFLKNNHTLFKDPLSDEFNNFLNSDNLNFKYAVPHEVKYMENIYNLFASKNGIDTMIHNNCKFYDSILDPEILIKFRKYIIKLFQSERNIIIKGLNKIKDIDDLFALPSFDLDLNKEINNSLYKSLLQEFNAEKTKFQSNIEIHVKALEDSIIINKIQTMKDIYNLLNLHLKKIKPPHLNEYNNLLLTVKNFIQGIIPYLEFILNKNENGKFYKNEIFDGNSFNYYIAGMDINIINTTIPNLNFLKLVDSVDSDFSSKQTYYTSDLLTILYKIFTKYDKNIIITVYANHCRTEIKLGGKPKLNLYKKGNRIKTRKTKKTKKTKRQVKNKTKNRLKRKKTKKTKKRKRRNKYFGKI